MDNIFGVIIFSRKYDNIRWQPSPNRCPFWKCFFFFCISSYVFTQKCHINLMLIFFYYRTAKARTPFALLVGMCYSLVSLFMWRKYSKGTFTRTGLYQNPGNFFFRFFLWLSVTGNMSLLVISWESRVGFMTNNHSAKDKLTFP